MKKRGQAGIGTILIFISIIFVVTLAAGVILQTSLDLQSKALLTASKAKDSVATTVSVRNIFGQDGTTGPLDELYLDVQILAGSSEVALDQLGIKVESNSQSNSYTYGSNVSTCTASSTSAGTFDVEYILESTGNTPGYLQQGDIARICLSSFNITENQNLLLTLSPKTGQLSMVEFSTPAVFETKSVSIYP